MAEDALARVKAERERLNHEKKKIEGWAMLNKEYMFVIKVHLYIYI